MPPRPRDPLGSLLRLIDLAGDDEHNIGDFIGAHAEEVAAALGVVPRDLEAVAHLDDFTLKRRLAPIVERARQLQREQRSSAAIAASASAVDVMSSSARWHGADALIDPQLLFSPEITNAPVAFVVFVADGFTVAIARTTLVKIRRDLPRFPDLVAIVGAGGLRLEWRAGRGRLFFFALDVPAAASRLVVRLRALERPAVLPRHAPAAAIPDVLEAVGFYFS